MASRKRKQVYNWGGYPKTEATVITPSSKKEVIELIRNEGRLIARGNGRCYGDASLNYIICSTLKLNKFIAFDRMSGLLTCESGVILDEILTVIVPQGFFLPVTPGTKFISLGGAVASNIHGKNHHKEGSFCDYVEWLEIISADGEVYVCSRNDHTGLFLNTCGGMGLTGIITKISFRLKKIESVYIDRKMIKAPNLDAIISAFEKYNDYTYSVAWIDCLAQGENIGRSLLMLGEHATKQNLPEKYYKKKLSVPRKRKFSIPFFFPSFVLNNTTVKLFNFFFYGKILSNEINNIIDYDSFFYPLDAIHDWNKIYGKDGFVQYQFVIPKGNGKQTLRSILEVIAKSGQGSFLAVLKLFGKENSYAPLNFPMEGYTLALDFKVQESLWPLLVEVDKIVSNAKGRLYLTKDARMSRDMFKETYPTANISYPHKFSSMQSERLGITI